MKANFNRYIDKNETKKQTRAFRILMFFACVFFLWLSWQAFFSEATSDWSLLAKAIPLVGAGIAFWPIRPAFMRTIRFINKEVWWSNLFGSKKLCLPKRWKAEPEPEEYDEVTLLENGQAIMTNHIPR